jgi:hypothetical protein
MTLMRFERRWAVAAMQAIFPGLPGSSDGGLSEIRATDIDGFLCELMVLLPWRAALGVRLAVWLVALAPLWVLYRFATIVRLTAGDRERVVVALMSSESYAVRSLALILKTMGALLYAADDRVRARLTTPRGVAQLRVKRVRVA